MALTVMVMSAAVLEAVVVEVVRSSSILLEAALPILVKSMLWAARPANLVVAGSLVRIAAERGE
jgi:hypothetical protein